MKKSLLLEILLFSLMIAIAIQIVTPLNELYKQLVMLGNNGYYVHFIQHSSVNTKAEILVDQVRPSDWVSFDLISKTVKRSVIISEDASFYRHHGFDFGAIQLAFKHYINEEKKVRGGSTLSQQLIKNLFFSQEKTLWRKIQEFILTMAMEKEWSKDRILEVYLNIVEWGPNIYGIGKASQFYFKKKASDLSAAEAAYLAILLPGPIKYGRSFKKRELTPFIRREINRVLQLLGMGVADENSIRLNFEKPLSLDSPPDPLDK